MTQITLSAEELAVLLTEAKNDGAQGSPDYSTADAFDCSYRAASQSGSEPLIVSMPRKAFLLFCRGES